MSAREPVSATKRNGSCEGHGGGDVEAPEQHMARLPQEEIDRILSMTTKLGPYLNPDDRELNPFSTPEELEKARERYRLMNEVYETSWASFCEFQAWVRSELAAKGFVEVDAGFYAELARNRTEVKLEEVDLLWLKIGEDEQVKLEEVDLSWLKTGEDDEYDDVIGAAMRMVAEDPFIYE